MFSGRDTGFSQNLYDEATTVEESQLNTIVPDTATSSKDKGKSRIPSIWRSPVVARQLADTDQLPPTTPHDTHVVGMEVTSAPTLAMRPVAQTVHSM